MECNLRCVNFRRVSDPRRAFLPAFRVTGITADCYSCTMGVIVIGLGTSQSASENFGCTWERRWQVSVRRRQASERRRQLWEHLESQSSSMGKTSSLGTLQARLEIIASTHRSTISKTHVFTLYFHLCIYIATHLHTVYLDWLQAVLESIRGAPEDDNQVNSEIHSEAVIGRLWRWIWRR